MVGFLPFSFYPSQICITLYCVIIGVRRCSARRGPDISATVKAADRDELPRVGVECRANGEIVTGRNDSLAD